MASLSRAGIEQSEWRQVRRDGERERACTGSAREREWREGQSNQGLDFSRKRESSVGESSQGLEQKEGEECGRHQQGFGFYLIERVKRGRASRSWILCIESDSGEKEMASRYLLLQRDELGEGRARERFSPAMKRAFYTPPLKPQIYGIRWGEVGPGFSSQ